MNMNAKGFQFLSKFLDVSVVVYSEKFNRLLINPVGVVEPSIPIDAMDIQGKFEWGDNKVVNDAADKSFKEKFV